MSAQYRRNAGIVVFNRHRQVLICKRNDVADSWQFPQGGIEEGETIIEAALRELYEETSIKSVIPVKSLTTPARYTFPLHIADKMKKRGYNNIGQDIFWSLVYFTGNDAEINLQTKEAEFSEYKWSDMNTACELIVDFKKSVYEIAKTAFEPIIDEYKI